MQTVWRCCRDSPRRNRHASREVALCGWGHACCQYSEDTGKQMMLKLAMLYNRSCVTFARVELLKSFRSPQRRQMLLWSGLTCLRTREEVALPSIHHTRATEDTPLADWRLWQRSSACLPARLNFLSLTGPVCLLKPCGCDVQTRPPLTETSTILCPL